MNSLKENKKKLREEYRRRRDAFHGQLDNATLNLAFRRPPSPLAKILETKKVVAVYASLGSEAPTTRLIEYLIEIDKNVAFPLVTGEKPLEFRAVSKLETLQPGFMGIAEPGDDSPPVVPDIIIAPMIAFDRSLNRLGQGGGHYDRTFEQYPDATRIGLAWSVQEADNIPTETHDQQLHAIVTESELIQKVESTS